MRSTWQPSPLELDGFACVHIEYEMRMLVEQCASLETRWEDVQAGRAAMGADGQAMLEAVLVHLRLLDDFLGDRRQAQANRRRWPRFWRRVRYRRSVFARHWDPGWKPTRVLDDRSRKRVNAKVAHLSADRATGGDWQPDELAPLVCRCCEVFESFVAGVQTREPARAAALAPARSHAARFVAAHRS